jgi:hypothetical protein
MDAEQCKARILEAAKALEAARKDTNDAEEIVTGLMVDLARLMQEGGEDGDDAELSDHSLG